MIHTEKIPPTAAQLESIKTWLKHDGSIPAVMLVESRLIDLHRELAERTLDKSSDAQLTVETIRKYEGFLKVLDELKDGDMNYSRILVL